jgi:hypothetical protein
LISNEHSRATAQVCVLVNGGAATAVLALLSKDKLDPTLLTQVSNALMIYAVGVLLGAAMMFCATETMDYWSQHWLASANGSGGDADKKARKADWWWRGYRYGSLVSMGCFAGASIWLAYGLGGRTYWDLFDLAGADVPAADFGGSYCCSGSS